MLYSNIKEISRNKKIPIMKIEEECGFSSGSVCKWNEVSPSVDKVKKVADYLGCEIEDLIRKLSQEEHACQQKQKE